MEENSTYRWSPNKDDQPENTPKQPPKKSSKNPTDMKKIKTLVTVILAVVILFSLAGTCLW